MAVQQPQTPRLQIIRRTCGLLAALLVAVSCGEDGPVVIPPRPETATHTMLLYMPGRSLATFYDNNVKGIREAVNYGVPGDGRILVCRQTESHDRADLLEIYYDYVAQQSAVTTLKTYEQFDAGDPASVAALLSDVQELAPARSYGLIIGCHGKAWVPAKQGTLSPRALRPGQSADETWTPAPGALVTRSFGDSGHELDIPELAEVLEALPVKLDYLIFDACFMANIETIYDLRNAADYYIAAPCEIMAAGFPYARTVPWLFADGGRRQDLQRVCEEFYRFYNDDPDNAQSGCISMAVLSEIAALVPIMQRIHATPEAYDPARLQYYEGMLTHLFYDLGDFVEAVCRDPQLLAEFAAQLDKAFPAACRLATPAFYSAYNNDMNPITTYSGVSTSEPSAKYAADYQLTDWYVATH